MRLELGYELGLLFSHHGVGDVLGFGLLLLSCLEHQLLLKLADGLSLFSADESLLVQQLELVLMAWLVLGSRRRRRSHLLVGHHCLGTLLRLWDLGVGDALLCQNGAFLLRRRTESRGHSSQLRCKLVITSVLHS